MCNIDAVGSMAKDHPCQCQCHLQPIPTSTTNIIRRKPRPIPEDHAPAVTLSPSSPSATTRNHTSRTASNPTQVATRPLSPTTKAAQNPAPQVAPWTRAALACIFILTLHSVHVLYHRARVSSCASEDALSPPAAASSSDLVLLVWCSGWITAVSTGIGAAPFYFIRNVSKNWVGFSNAVAAGMMLAASAGLMLEAAAQESADLGGFPLRAIGGCAMGVGFIKISENVFDGDHHEMMQMGDLDMRKMVLIMAVMTLHSFSEGVAIGVAYHSQSLGGVITTTLAIHNIPEGLALSIVLIPRGMSKLGTTLWCVFSSIPQPLMAVPAFLFAESFQVFVPIGLGFAAGAMVYVALFELYADAYEALSGPHATITLFLSGILMSLLQACV